ncbi:hypothetical protein SUDANB6_01887 [Streptomyces sp. enrichment culture]
MPPGRSRTGRTARPVHRSGRSRPGGRRLCTSSPRPPPPSPCVRGGREVPHPPDPRRGTGDTVRVPLPAAGGGSEPKAGTRALQALDRARASRGSPPVRRAAGPRWTLALHRPAAEVTAASEGMGGPLRAAVTGCAWSTVPARPGGRSGTASGDGKGRIPVREETVRGARGEERANPIEGPLDRPRPSDPAADAPDEAPRSCGVNRSSAVNPTGGQGKNLTRALPNRGGMKLPNTRQMVTVFAQTRTITLVCDGKHTH